MRSDYRIDSLSLLQLPIGLMQAGDIVAQSQLTDRASPELHGKQVCG